MVADINGDGSPDILIGDEAATFSAFDNAGHLLPGFPIAVGSEIKGTAAVCDCDGDGMTEIVVEGNDRNLYVWDYDFPFSPGVQPPWPQFHHDVMHTGFASRESAVTVPPGGSPKSLSLATPVPNPARNLAALAYEVPDALAGQPLTLEVFDPAGRKIRRLAEGAAIPGRFTYSWDLRDADRRPIKAGLYLIVLRTGGERTSRRIVAIP